MTIFGPSWSELGIEAVQGFLDQADDEPLLWEAKGTRLDKNEIRRQVCAFANSHEGGYLILGAVKSDGPDEPAGWQLQGVEFPDEPGVWVSALIGDPEKGVRPRPDFDVLAWGAPGGQVAVVRVEPVSTPPCIANGTVYERLPGRSQTVRDPIRLSELFTRGDHARREAQARADRAARIVLEDWLQGEAGEFQRPGLLRTDDADEAEHARRQQSPFFLFSVGVAATGNPPDIAARLFQDVFAEEVWTRLRDRPTGLPPGFGSSPDAVYWSQDALTWRHQLQGMVEDITVVRANWDGSVAAGQKIAVEDVLPDSLVDHRIAPQWRVADELVDRLGGFGDVYVTVTVVGDWPRRRAVDPIEMRRGPLLPGVDLGHVASLSRELMRAVGNPEPEPEP